MEEFGLYAIPMGCFLLGLLAGYIAGRHDRGQPKGGEWEAELWPRRKGE